MTETNPSVAAAVAAETDHRPLTDVVFENFGLHPLLLQGLNDAGFIRCTPIQALTLPVALPGRDVAGQAQTGTGKTAAFLVAVMNRLLTQPARAERTQADPRAVILAPTRELAIQIDKDAKALGRTTGLRTALIYGGVDYDKQRELLREGTDIVIATPGRLIDYVKQHVVNLRSVEVVVLDEADRMFDLGFIKDIRFLLRRMPAREERQSLLFSATLSHRVLELAYEHMNSPEKLTVETESVTAERVRQVVYFPANDEKIPLLISLLTRKDASRTMVFVNTKAWVERVARALEQKQFRVGVLSGDVPQAKREKLLARFQRGELEILVATDVAARGLHIAGVSHVFNFDLPFEAEDYVHRIGRTARLGAEGDAISFACELYAMGLPAIESYIGMKIPVASIEPELLVPLPRTPKPLPEGESASVVAEAFSERVQPKGDSRGGRGGRRDGGRPGERGGERRGERRRGEGGERRGNDAGGGRGERGPRREGPRPPRADAPVPAATPDGVTGASATPVASGVPDPAMRESSERKRRRRRRGRRDGEAAAGTAEAAAPMAAKAETHGGAHERPRLLSRIKQGFQRIFSRLSGPKR
jgi:ATP-dependent RNA helicase RhlB